MRRITMEVKAVVNEQNRTGGFSPAQWVLGRRPIYSAGEQGDGETAGQIGSLEQRDDPTTIFGERMEYRHVAKKAFVHVDSSKRVASALLRKAALKAGSYQVGDLVSFQREQGSAGSRRNRWSSPSRIIGFEQGGKVCWVICEGVPFCLATDKLHPASDAQALAYRLMHEGEDRLAPEVQQSFIDNRNLDVADEDKMPYLEESEKADIDISDSDGSEDEDDRFAKRRRE